MTPPVFLQLNLSILKPGFQLQPELKGKLSLTGKSSHTKRERTVPPSFETPHIKQHLK